MIIKKASERAKETIQQLLTFSRQTEQKYQPVKLQDIIKECMNPIRISMPSTRKLNHEVDDGCPPVFADPTQLHQVIMNLGVNAQLAIEEGDELVFKLDRVDLDEAEAQTHQNLDAPIYLA